MSAKISAYITRLNGVLMMSFRIVDFQIGYIISSIPITINLTSRGWYISASVPNRMHPMTEAFFVDEVFIDGNPFNDVYILVTPNDSD